MTVILYRVILSKYQLYRLAAKGLTIELQQWVIIVFVMILSVRSRCSQPAEVKDNWDLRNITYISPDIYKHLFLIS